MNIATARSLIGLPILLVMLPGSITAQMQDWCSEADSRNQYCEVRELTLLPRNGQLSVDVGPNGSIRVEGYDGPDVQVMARLVARAGSERAAEAIADRVEINTRDGEITTEGPRTRGRESWSVSVRMRVPIGTELSLRTTNGAITVERTQASVDARTTNGTIRMDDVMRSVQARSTNGSIRVSLSTRTADIDGMQLRTTNGGIHLALPANASARLSASTTNGSINSDLPITIRGTVGRRNLTGTLGDGGSEIILSTTNGGIRITGH